MWSIFRVGARVAQSNVFHSGALVEWLDAPDALGIIVNPRTVDFLDDWNAAMFNDAPKKKLEGLVRAQALKNKPGRSLPVRLLHALF